MARPLAILAAAIVYSAPTMAHGNATIPWTLEVKQGVAHARKTGHPLMFWVLGRSASRNDRVERDQKQAFKDPLVLELSRRFVPVKLSRSRYRDLLEKWNLSSRTNLAIVFVTPEGDKIDTLSPGGVRNPKTLARKMTLVYRYYRRQIFEREVKPKLEDPEASEADLRQSLEQISDFLILSADQSVIDLLDKRPLSPGLQNDIYDTLAALSTPASVDVLLEQAVEDKRAAAALKDCTPEAAERMLEKLESEDPDLRLAVYHAVAHICKLRNVKSDRFWHGRIESLKRDERARVRRLVKATAERWRERYAEYR